MADRRTTAGLVACLALLALLAGCGDAATPTTRDERGASTAQAKPKPSPSLESTPIRTAQPDPRPDKPSDKAEGKRPNIVLVQADDLSMDLVQTMRAAREMRRRGASYPGSFVVDSLCCVSRASMWTGQYPHQTGVLTNSSLTPAPEGPHGGFAAFAEHGNLRRAFNTGLFKAGYATGFVGKYLNEYEYLPGVLPLPAVPPGWSRFHVLFGSAYDGWGFHSLAGPARDPIVTDHPTPSAGATAREKDAAYAGQVIEDYALDFIRDHQDGAKPYFLLVSTYAPHSRTDPQGAWPGEPVFPAAFRDRPGPGKPGNCGLVRCADLGPDDLPGWRVSEEENLPVRADGTTAPNWHPDRPPPSRASYLRDLRQRAQMTQSLDRTLRKILRAVNDNTYVIFTSDNGFHLGQSGLRHGKGTAYDTDIRVPLLVVGPRVAPGERAELAMNIDLAPTFEDLAGVRTPRYRSGVSLVPSLEEPARARRDVVFVEHTAEFWGRDPDVPFTGGELTSIPSYVAVRSRDGLLIRHNLTTDPGAVDRAFEFYSYARRGFEAGNEYGRKPHRTQIRRLEQALDRWDACRVATGNAPVPPRCRDVTRLPDGGRPG